MKALLLDHDDSFTFNLRDWLKPAFDEVHVVNHRDSLKIQELPHDLLILSPGPKSPQDYPHVLELIQKTSRPIFGVCLGLQLLAQSEGAEITAYAPPKHGKTSKLQTRSSLQLSYPELADIRVARYHSLACFNFENDFETWAVADDDQKPMWLRHKSKKQMGVQFHPESFLTEKSDRIRRVLTDWCRS